MLDHKQKRKQQAYTTDHDVSHSEVRVFTTELADGADHNGLGAIEAGHFIVGNEFKDEFIAALEVVVDLAIQLSEPRKCSWSHPHAEVLVVHPVQGRYQVRIGLVQVLGVSGSRVVVVILFAGLRICIRLASDLIRIKV